MLPPMLDSREEKDGCSNASPPPDCPCDVGLLVPAEAGGNFLASVWTGRIGRRLAGEVVDRSRAIAWVFSGPVRDECSQTPSTNPRATTSTARMAFAHPGTVPE